MMDTAEQALEAYIPTIVERTQTLTIQSQAEADHAKALLGEIVDRRTAIEAYWQPLVSQAFAHHRALTAKRKEMVDRLAEPERIVRRALADHEMAKIATAKVAARLDEEDAVLMPVAPTQGIQLTERWSAEIEDLGALVAAVAAGTVKIDALEANLPWLNAEARKHKGALKIPGVAATCESSVRRTK